MIQLLLGAVDPPTNWVTFMLAAGAVLGGVGYAAGQFISSRRKGVSDALATALNEVAAMKLRADRLEAEAKTQSAKHELDMTALRTRLTLLEAENKTLREALSSGVKLAPEFQQLIQDQLKYHEERSEVMLRDAGHAMAEGLRAAVATRDDHEAEALKEFEARIRKRHHRFADALPEPERTALLKSLED